MDSSEIMNLAVRYDLLLNQLVTCFVGSDNADRTRMTQAGEEAVLERTKIIARLASRGITAEQLGQALTSSRMVVASFFPRD